MKNKERPATLPSQITVVEASAGSGKTYCLASRYLRLLLNEQLKGEEIPLKDILAITFSNKAAFEMKERILEFLKRIALDRFSSSDEKREFLGYLSASEDKAGRKACLILDEIIYHYNSFQVQTIDSFINAILCGCAFKLHLSAAFKIKNSHAEYLSYSFDKFIDRANNDGPTRKIFLDFIEQYLRLENKKSWLPKAGILSVMENLFNLTSSHGAEFIRYDKQAQDIFLKRERIRNLMLELKKMMPEGANLQTWGSFVNSFDEETTASGIDRFFGPFSRDEFKMKKNFSPSDEALGLWRGIREDIAQLYEWKAFSFFNRYIDIFEGIIHYFDDISRKEDTLLLSQLNCYAQRLFEEGGMVVPELYCRLATRFRHFLIDEFQDTSILQWKNLFPMVEEALATGGTLFYVGDKKQAIYRFRGGDVSLIEEVKKELGRFKATEEALTRNYRSQKEIVEFNNVVFSRENLLRLLSCAAESKNSASGELSAQDREDIVSVFNESCQVYGQENKYGYVKAEFIEAQDTPEAEGIIRAGVMTLLSELKERFDYRDIALLARSNKDVELFTSWLLEAGIPVESEKTLNIRENVYIKELVSFLRFLNSPIDNLSFASFILGDIFTCASGIPREALGDFLFRIAAGQRAASGYLYIEFRREFQAAWDGLIAEFLKGVGLIPLYELLISILHKFRAMDNFPQYQGFFMKLLELVKAQEEDNQNISLFLEFFEAARPEELYVNVSGKNSVKAMTIHKSKGLEFAVVIIPFLEMNVKVGAAQNNSRAFAAYPEKDGLSLNYLAKDECLGFSALLKSRYLAEYKKSFIDELNNIYVAFTRAKFELYIFLRRRSPKGPNLAAALIPEDSAEKGGKRKYDMPPSGLKDMPAKEIGLSRYQDWIRFLKDEFEEVSLIGRRDVVLRGEILHYILSLIGSLSPDEVDGALKAAMEKARRRFAFVKDWPGLESAVRGLVLNEAAAKFFFVKGARVYQEREVVNAFGDTRRIDRLVVTLSEAMVIDYKSSRLNGEAYKAQVREYMALIKEIYPGLRVRGFLIYLDELSIEEVDGKDNKL